MNLERFDELATKADLTHTRELISRDILSLEARLEGKLARLEHRLTMRMAAGVVATCAIIGALQVLL